ncbi:MAG: HEPN domain-containing protein [Oscillospiraceae bacterium]|nr:HEPN domain-containing protein [Oscillospiraceae bacterium]
MDKAIVKEWLKYASNDLEAANHLLSLHPLKLEIICYLCQQSAEKMLKAFWLYSDVFPPKTHDLELLRNKCEEFHASFLELAGECIRLNDYSSQPRYPFNLEITDDDMQMAIKDSKKISKFVKSLIILDKEDEDNA